MKKINKLNRADYLKRIKISNYVYRLGIIASLLIGARYTADF